MQVLLIAFVRINFLTNDFSQSGVTTETGTIGIVKVLGTGKILAASEHPPDP